MQEKRNEMISYEVYARRLGLVCTYSILHLIFLLRRNECNINIISKIANKARTYKILKISRQKPNIQLFIEYLIPTMLPDQPEPERRDYLLTRCSRKRCMALASKPTGCSATVRVRRIEIFVLF